MSAILTPGNDLLTRSTPAKPAPSPFTTFARGHFVRPATTAQPVTASFAYGMVDLYVAAHTSGTHEMYLTAPLDLDYEEPNAVCDGADVEVVSQA